MRREPSLPLALFEVCGQGGEGGREGGGKRCPLSKLFQVGGGIFNYYCLKLPAFFYMYAVKFIVSED